MSTLPVQVDEVRDDLKALIELGYLRWTDPRSVDEFPDDEPLPIEVVEAIPRLLVTEEQEAGLLAALGVSEERHGRIVRLSPRSELVCPAHEYVLRPDACRSCKALAGEA